MEKIEALELTIQRLEKQYGKGTIMRLDSEVNIEVDTISTGSLGLDMALGIGGLPKGRIIELYGQASAGKTTIALHAIAECQKNGGIAAFVDAEHALDPIYAKHLGVDTDNLYISQPDNGEQALEVANHLIQSGGVDIIVIDSVAALVPRAEIEGEMGEAKVGLHARLMSQAMRKITGAVARNNCCCIFINQMREKIGIQFGNPNVTTGGKALKFYSSMRLEVSRTAKPITDKSSNAIGNTVKVKVAKNKLAPPFRVAIFDMLYGQGISKMGELIDIGVERDIIHKGGSWYSYGDVKLGQGKDSARLFLEDNPELAEEVENKILELDG